MQVWKTRVLIVALRSERYRVGNNFALWYSYNHRLQTEFLIASVAVLSTWILGTFLP